MPRFKEVLVHSLIYRCTFIHYTDDDSQIRLLLNKYFYDITTKDFMEMGLMDTLQSDLILPD